MNTNWVSRRAMNCSDGSKHDAISANHCYSLNPNTIRHSNTMIMQGARVTLSTPSILCYHFRVMDFILFSLYSECFIPGFHIPGLNWSVNTLSWINFWSEVYFRKRNGSNLHLWVVMFDASRRLLILAPIAAIQKSTSSLLWPVLNFSLQELTTYILALLYPRSMFISFCFCWGGGGRGSQWSQENSVELGQKTLKKKCFLKRVDRWRRESKSEATWKPEQALTDNEVNSYMCLRVGAIQPRVSDVSVSGRFKGWPHCAALVLLSISHIAQTARLLFLELQRNCLPYWSVPM